MPTLFFFTILTPPPISLFFFFNDTATTEIYTLSLHDALPICSSLSPFNSTTLKNWPSSLPAFLCRHSPCSLLDRKSTRLNSSHQIISYAVFCLKKKIIRFNPFPSPFCHLIYPTRISLNITTHI